MFLRIIGFHKRRKTENKQSVEMRMEEIIYVSGLTECSSGRGSRCPENFQTKLNENEFS